MYYAGFFSLGKCFWDPKTKSFGPKRYSPSQNWCYQAAMPAYAQAVSSSYADLLFEEGSHLVLANFPASYPHGTYPSVFGPVSTMTASPWLWSGAPNRIAVARKAASKEQYVIAATIERKSNQVGNSLAQVNASILLPTSPDSTAGINTKHLQFEIRLQGSVYIYDATSAGAPKFYQIDGWHEVAHPSYWSKHSAVEAEIFRTHLQENSVIHTELPPGTTSGDFRTFTTFVAVGGDADGRTMPRLVYDVSPASWVWLRVRLSTVYAREAGSATAVRIGSSTTQVASTLTASEEWGWRRVSSNASQQAELLLEISGAAIDLDRLIVTDDEAFAAEATNGFNGVPLKVDDDEGIRLGN